MKRKVLLLSLGLVVLSGCSSHPPIVPEVARSNEATLGAVTKTEKMLRELPPAKKPLTVSVYKFNDLTGQNKPGETPQYSRAVTQGGLAILKNALLDAGSHTWFRVLERGGLQDLLQERKIIRAMRSEYLGPDGKKLPPLSPLLYSGIILEGGIVAYESNVMTGGAGARYLGIGGSTQYSRDMVTVYLRLVSVNNGEVLLSVNASKTIYSTSTQGGVFYFVAYDELAEGETGFTMNEPPQLAVRQAIEMAVYALIMEGYKQKLWEFSDPVKGRQLYAQYVRKYHGERDSAENSRMAMNTTEEGHYSSDYPVSAVKPAAAEKAAMSDKFLNTKLRRKEDIAGGQLKTAYQSEHARSEATGPSEREPQFKTREQLGRGWYVQVLAVKSINAEEREIIEELIAHNLPVVIQKATVASVSYYRILVGAFASRSLAEKVRYEIALLATKKGNVFGRRVYSIAKI
ncbi:MAG: hypothetical protein D6719_05945 [Candidatus Dadabacteria bacterium]|nr:MAG: hypothetical protein D6719_05945 [Candidatus Dadabacteria bacterium]